MARTGARAPLSESTLQYAIHLLNLAAVVELVRGGGGQPEGRANEEAKTPALEALILETPAPPIDDSGSPTQ